MEVFSEIIKENGKLYLYILDRTFTPRSHHWTNTNLSDCDYLFKLVFRPIQRIPNHSVYNLRN